MFMVASFALRVKLLASTNFFSSLSLAAMNTVWAVFLFEFFGSNATASLVAGIISVGTLIFSLLFIHVLERQKSKVLMVLSLSGFAFAFIIFGLMKKQWLLFILASFAIMCADAVRKHTFGELTKHQGSRQQLFFLEGVMYVVCNIGWLIGPLVASLLFHADISVVFLVSGVFMIVAALLTEYAPLIDAPGHKIHESLWSSAQELFSHEVLRKAFLFNMGLNMWWPVIFLFMPLYVLEQGLPKTIIGIVLFASIIPVIVIEMLIGKYGKKFGEEFFFKLGFAILALCSVGMFLIDDPIWVLSLIVVSGVGAGAIEPTQETFFFRLVSRKSEKRLFAVYLSSYEVGMLISKLFGAFLLIVLPFRVLFLFFGLVMAGLFFLVEKKMSSQEIT
jgi:MFS family permease